AAISSFGISGTNAHLILEEPPTHDTTTTDSDAGGPTRAPVALPFVVSAKTPDALAAQAGRLRDLIIGNPQLDPVDVAHSLISSRTALDERAVVVAGGREQLLDGLAALAAGRSAPHLVRGSAAAAPPPTVFLFPGQGSQWRGMAVELLDSSDVFRNQMEACAEALAPYVDWSPVDVVRGKVDAPPPDAVDVLQPTLFAVMVSLAAMWRSFGVAPDAVTGHSQGEVAAAYVAGGLSLADAARVVALRSRAVRDLAGDGGMASVSLPVAEVEACLARWPERLGVAAVNSPCSTVVAGDRAALDELLAQCVAEGVWARLIPVDYASHTSRMERLRDQLRNDLAALTPGTGEVPFYSTVTGDRLDTIGLDADYWYRNIRHTVQFERASRALLGDGYRLFLEVSPHPVLATAIEETVERSAAVARSAGTLRRDEGDWRHFLAAVAEIHVQGHPVDWRPAFAGRTPRRVDLPTYPFQHQRYWLAAPAAGHGDISSAGLRSPDHALLGSVVELSSSDGLVLTGRISPQTHPWLADHAALDTTLLPATALLELTLHAGALAGCPHLDDLTLHAPLPLCDNGVDLQVTVDDPDPADRRAVTVHSRSAGAGIGEPWTRHATGTLTSTVPVAQTTSGPWLPADAVPIDTDKAYDILAERGYQYGPVFQGLRAAWECGSEIYAEVQLPEQADSSGFGIHPALFDAALHPLGLLAGRPGDQPETALPFAFSGVTLHTSGATELRVHLSPSGEGGFRLQATDTAGTTVVTVDAVVTRPISPRQLSVGPRNLYELSWTSAPVGAGQRAERWSVIGTAPDWLADADTYPDPAALAAAVGSGLPAPEQAVVFCAPSHGGEAPPDAARRLLSRTLDLVRGWLRDDRLAATRLVVVTHGAVATDEREDPDLGQAPVWGLVRTAQAEDPGRLVLLDLDQHPHTRAALPAVLAGDEPQLALRAGTRYVPRLARATPPTEAVGPPWNPEGTVLVTGGTGSLGSLIARRLVTHHGVRHLVLASRRGAEADGAAALVSDLHATGASVTVQACDVSDRDAVAELLADIPAAHPLTAVVHTAGVLRDATIASLTEEQLTEVLRPKVDAIWHLHELTERLDPVTFVLFSSAAGVLGTPGQANYAAANAFLDALAQHRCVAGRPATSLAWGLWAQESGMTGHLDGDAGTRTAGSGFTALATDEALALFDAALPTGRPMLVPVGVDLAALRAQARDAALPALLRKLAGTTARRGAGRSASLARRLAGLPDAERHNALLDLVRGTAADVLAHQDPRAVEDERGFLDQGFDSLTALQLRNRLAVATGLRLPATLVFDHPTPRRLAGYLRDRFAAATAPPSPPVLAELGRLEAALTVPGWDTGDLRDTVRGRLQDLARRLSDRAPQQHRVADRIAAATAEEIFHLIDTELSGAGSDE
ncbi:type I polyketide synthase, partial [Micromonospora luteifusca]|uniref:type I polyketide synthase n=1 Tax=Micromonospora luteifusca TaxID=709860 RepID=UPI0033AB4F92